MSKLEKRIAALRKARGVRFEEIEAVLLHLGFVMRPGKGDHRVYEHAAYRFRLTLDARPRVRPVYVRQALGMIDAIMEDKRHDS